MTEPAAPPGAGEAMTDLDYATRTDAVLAAVEARIDDWLQRDVIDIDTLRNGGVLELAFPNGSKIVLNCQPPLQELWLAARSGGMHYRWRAGAWRDTRDGTELHVALSTCASEQAGQALLFESPRQAG